MNTIKSFALSLLILATGNTFAAGPLLAELHHTVEEARITVIAEENSTQGAVTAKLLECNGCEPATYTFDQSTIFINALGAERPIDELKSWSGGRAMFHYLKANGHIEPIEILP